MSKLVNQLDPKPALYALTPQQNDTIQFVLGHYAGLLAASPDPSLNMYKHDDLIALGESLKQPGLTFSDIVPLFAESADSNAYVLAAKKHVREGEFEVDCPAVVSNGDDAGAYVMGWVWVSNEEARCATIDGYDVAIDEDGDCGIVKTADGRRYYADMTDLINNEELVCPREGNGNNHYHSVPDETIKRIAAWIDIVEATIPTEETLS